MTPYLLRFAVTFDRFTFVKIGPPIHLSGPVIGAVYCCDCSIGLSAQDPKPINLSGSVRSDCYLSQFARLLALVNFNAHRRIVAQRVGLLNCRLPEQFLCSLTAEQPVCDIGFYII